MKFAGNSAAFFFVRLYEPLAGKDPFGLLALGNIDARADVPIKRAVRVEPWHTRCHHPAIFAVVAPEPMFELKGLSPLKGLLGNLAASIRFFWVEDHYL